MEIYVIILIILQDVYTFYWFWKYQKIIDIQAKEIVRLRTNNNALELIFNNLKEEEYEKNAKR